ncbi:ribonucleotide-diphosphate reductase subunit beta (plasmid) [Erythrobacter aureus]|uniref:Ribonucleoside-diphosphate reductase subunit beta n=2 Tax=Erythrobacter aureus TaxID=2182384 RepID=A0A345YJQ3_9SPHN|nr:ribonucleotide-diphosphate reductase subunit beta [Erythrobacter aureus]
MCRPSETYKPFHYPWAHEAWKRQRQIDWPPEEITMGYDARDYATLNDAERGLINNILKLFTQSDIDVANNYMTLYSPIFRNGEIARMLRRFGSMEDTHVEAYSLLLETLGFPDSHYNAFLEVEEMREKHDMLTGYKMRDPKEIATSLALIGAFGEGLQLFSSFAMLLNFSANMNKMKGMGQVITWSIRDETLHVASIIKLFHEFRKEAGLDLSDVKEGIMQGLHKVVMLEDAFIDRAFELGPVGKTTPEDYKQYVRYTADFRLGQLDLDPIYHVETHPLPWLENELNGVEHANFFETRATEYSKGALQGDWGDVWGRHDEARAKAAA